MAVALILDTSESLGIMPFVRTKILSSLPIPLAIANVLLLLSIITKKAEIPIIIEVATEAKLLRLYLYSL
jgi:hypothetical protein